MVLLARPFGLLAGAAAASPAALGSSTTLPPWSPSPPCSPPPPPTQPPPRPQASALQLQWRLKERKRGKLSGLPSFPQPLPLQGQADQESTLSGCRALVAARRRQRRRRRPPKEAKPARAAAAQLVLETLTLLKYYSVCLDKVHIF